jgi:Predicted Zn-dependent protease (DUF2268)
MKSLLLIIKSIILFYFYGHAQPNYKKLADSLYKAKSYTAAAENYKLAAANEELNKQKAGNFYNASCSYSLDGKKDSAIAYLKKAIYNGFDDKKNLLADTDFDFLRKDSLRWKQLLSLVKEPSASNKIPAKAIFHTEDIKQFWIAYDKAMLDTANMLKIFKAEYFDKGSAGMNDYMALKVRNTKAFVKHIKERPKFYAAIRANTYKVDTYKKDFYESFKKLKSIYEPAVFPDVYFIMGAFTSAGTVSPKGLLLGINQMVKTKDIPTDELTLWQKNTFAELYKLKYTVAHELIHAQQESLKQDTTTLYYCIMEGMADFIGELISGKNSNDRLHTWAKGKEQKIWNRFVPDMYLNKYENWIANSDQETKDNPSDQGYWIGYQICKAYYDKAKNKKQALYDMLHIQDYKKFLEESGWEMKIAGFKE